MSGAGVWTSDVRRTAAVRTAAHATRRSLVAVLPGTSGGPVTSDPGVRCRNGRRPATVQTIRRSRVDIPHGPAAGPVTSVPGVRCRNGRRPATVQTIRLSRVHNLPRTAGGAVMRFPGAAGRNGYLPATVRTAAPAPGRGTAGSVPGTPPRPVEP